MVHAIHLLRSMSCLEGGLSMKSERTFFAVGRFSRFSRISPRSLTMGSAPGFIGLPNPLKLQWGTANLFRGLNIIRLLPTISSRQRMSKSRLPFCITIRHRLNFCITIRHRQRSGVSLAAHVPHLL